MDRPQKNQENQQRQREIVSDQKFFNSQNGLEDKLKVQLDRIQQVLKSEKSYEAKVIECLQVIEAFSKDIPPEYETIDDIETSVQSIHIQSDPLHKIIQQTKMKMGNIHKQVAELRAAKQQMKQELDKLTELKKSLKSRIEGLDTGQSLRQTNLLDSLGAEQAKLQKRMSAEEKEEATQDSKLFLILDKIKQKYEEALKNQKTTSEQLEKQSLLLQERTLMSQELEETNRFLQNENAKLAEEGKTKDQKLENEKRKLEDISAKMTTFEKHNKEPNEMLERGDKDATKTRDLQLKIKELNQELARKKSETKKQETLVSDLINQNSTLKKEIAQKDEELSKSKEQIKRQREALTKHQLFKSQSDKLNKDNLRRNSELEKELNMKKDEMLGINLRHRDQINSHKQALAKLTKKHQQAQEQSLKLKAVSQPNTLQEMHHLVKNYLYPGKSKHQMTTAEKEAVTKKRDELRQAIAFL